MKKKYFIRAVLGLFVAYFFIFGLELFIVSVRFEFRNGVYDRLSGFFMCRTEKACQHEIGHWKDDDLEWPSNSEDFIAFIDKQINLCRATNLSFFMCEFEDFPGVSGNPKRENGWGGYREIYARIYSVMRLDGEPNMPKLIRFYSSGWDE